MQSFLDQLSEYLLTKLPVDIKNTSVVLPSRRSGIYLKHILGRKAGRALILPDIFSIEDFITGISYSSIIDPVFLQFNLYAVHQEIEGENAQGLIEFLGWAPVLLKDFNEIDLYLKDAEEVFGFLTEAKAIKMWNLDGSPLTAFEKQYLEFYQSFSKYYTGLQQKLKNQHMHYQGMVYKKVALGIQAYLDQMPYDHIVFAGFNALTPAEEKIMFEIEQRGKGSIIWDADQFYVSNPLHEAGFFLNKYLSRSGKNQALSVGDYFKNPQRKDTVIGVPRQIAQVKIAAQLIQDLNLSEENAVNTVVVLNDESLLLPMMNALPDEMGKFNISMGLSITGTSLFGFFNVLIRLRENAEKYGKLYNADLRFYHKDLEALFIHPYFEILIKERPNETFAGDLITILRNKSKAYYKISELDWFLEKIPDELSGMFQVFNTPVQQVLYLFDNMVKLLYEKLNEDSSFQLELHYLSAMADVFLKLKKISDQFSFFNDLKIFKRLFLQICGSVKIPLSGEPVKGLQIMGMLETRALDFKNVIMLSVNEGILPRGKSMSTLIPYEIKHEFGLPTYQNNTRVFAYHFYRLLQRAEKTFIIYNTEPDELGGGEKSRFISQILYELPLYNGKDITHEIRSVIPSGEMLSGAISIEKNKVILQKLDDLAVSGFSPSSLNTYVACSLQFYFRYIAGVRETGEVEENIESYTMGTVVHKVLQSILSPFIESEIQYDLLKKDQENIRMLLDTAFDELYPGGNMESGKNFLAREASFTLIRNYLNWELNNIREREGKKQSVKLIALEQEYTSKVEADKRIVQFKGKIDRIDSIDEVPCIIDYKTGRVEKKDVSFKKMEDVFKSGKGKAFQVLFYAYLYAAETNIPQIQTGIISLSSLKNGYIANTVTREEIVSFESNLIQLMQEIFDPSIPFSQTDDDNNCQYCDFKTVCNRL